MSYENCFDCPFFKSKPERCISIDLKKDCKNYKMEDKLENLVNKFLSYFEKNMTDVFLDYILMTWFIGQDKKREMEYKKLRLEIIDESKELAL